MREVRTHAAKGLWLVELRELTSHHVTGEYKFCVISRLLTQNEVGAADVFSSKLHKAPLYSLIEIDTAIVSTVDLSASFAENGKGSNGYRRSRGARHLVRACALMAFP